MCASEGENVALRDKKVAEASCDRLADSVTEAAPETVVDGVDVNHAKAYTALSVTTKILSFSATRPLLSTHIRVRMGMPR